MDFNNKTHGTLAHHAIFGLLSLFVSTSAFSEEVAHFATEQECWSVNHKIDQTYASISDYDGTLLYMNGNKVVNIDCNARITNFSFNKWGYVNGTQFKSEPKMIIETREEFSNRLDRLTESRNSRDNFIGDRANTIMLKHGL